ncbi:RDD family protein, partial [Motilibacter deserti]
YGQPQYGAQQYGQQYGQPGYGYPSAPGYGGGYGQQAYVGTPASMGKRLGARLLDGLIIGVPALVVLIVLWVLPFAAGSSTEELDEFGDTTTNYDPNIPLLLLAILATLVVFVLAFLYEPVLTARRGATYGKSILGIKVTMIDGQPITSSASWIRWAVFQLPGIIVPFWQLVFAISPFFDGDRRQGFHDKVAKTLVVESR